MLRDITNTALRYGTFWPGALAQDSYRIYKRRRLTQNGRAVKRPRRAYSRAYRPTLGPAGLNLNFHAGIRTNGLFRTIGLGPLGFFAIL